MRLTGVAMMVCVLGLVGCGGSGDDHGTLVSQFHQHLQQSSQPPPADLTSCMTSEAQKLSTSQLKQINATLSSDASLYSPQARGVLHLMTTCVAQGKGTDVLRASLLAPIEAKTATLPPAYATCVTGKARAISGPQLASLLQTGSQGQAALHAAGEQLGRQYGTECLSEPSVMSAMRALFINPIRTGLAKYSPAFSQCVLQQANAISTSTLEGMISQPATAAQRSEALGRGWAQQCVHRGIRP